MTAALAAGPISATSCLHHPGCSAASCCRRFDLPCRVQICREADGYRPHLVSPEKGIKRLVQEAMMQTSPHVHKFVDEIHLVLQETVRGCCSHRWRTL